MIKYILLMRILFIPACKKHQHRNYTYKTVQTLSIRGHQALNFHDTVIVTADSPQRSIDCILSSTINNSIY